MTRSGPCQTTTKPIKNFQGFVDFNSATADGAPEFDVAKRKMHEPNVAGSQQRAKRSP